MISHDSTHKPTHPQTKPYIHPCLGEPPEIQNLQTESKYLDLFYIIFTDSGGTPLGGWVELGACSAHACAHTHTCMHSCTCIHTHGEYDEHGYLHGVGHLQFLNMFILAFHACACMQVHVHMSRDTP